MSMRRPNSPSHANRNNACPPREDPGTQVQTEAYIFEDFDPLNRGGDAILDLATIT